MSNEIEIKKTQTDWPQDYEQLVDQISTLWDRAKGNAVFAVNSELLMANWQTGRYIVEFEQGGNARAEYGQQLLVKLSKDLTIKRGKGFSRSNLIYMRKFYLTFKFPNFPALPDGFFVIELHFHWIFALQ